MKRYKICPSCGMHNDPSAIECINCEEDLMTVRITDEEVSNTTSADKSSLKTKMVRICYCGAKNPANARKCQDCGDDISTIIPQPDTLQNKMWFLSGTDGDCVFDLKEGINTIGRECGISEYLKDRPYVSRKHADLVKEGEKLYIRSYGANHSFINNVQIPDNEMVEVKNDDIISLGGKEINGEKQKEAAYFRAGIK